MRDANYCTIGESRLNAWPRLEGRRHLAREVAAVLECNQALLQASTELQLLQDVCRIAVEVGGYGFAWAALPGNDATLRTVARSGADVSECPEQCRFAHRCGPALRALEQGGSIAVQDVASDPSTLPCRHEAAERGCASILSLPLMEDDRPFAVLVIGASETHAFNEQEKTLLGGLAENLAYGVLALRARENVRRNSEELRRLVNDVSRRENEARCLYSIINVIEEAGGADELLQRIVTMIPQACNVDDIACARITLGARAYDSPGFKETPWKATAAIMADADEAGRLEVFYRAPQQPLSRDPFSPQEFDLIEAIAREVGLALDRREAQAQVRQAQKMDALGRMASGITHDFNSLLTIITSYSEMLLEETESGTSNHHRLSAIRKAAHRGTNLTQQLLAFSRRQPLTPTVLHLNSVITSLAPMLQRVLGKEATLDLRLQPGVPTIKADAGQMGQVLLNLVINAHDAIADHGTVTISTEAVSLRATAAAKLGLQPGPYAELTVRDTGAGMDAETLSHLFEPFFTTKSSGTGLGLAIVHGIVKQSAGGVAVTSVVGKGTTFRAYFPHEAEEARI